MTSHFKNSLMRKTAAVALTAATVTGLSTGAAQAQQLPQGSVQLPTQADVDNWVAQTQTGVNNWVLQQYDMLYAQSNTLPEQVRVPVQGALDNTANFLAPGALEARRAEQARAAAAAQAEAARIAAEREAEARRAAAAATPCPAWAKACVDINGRRSWLQDGQGNTVFGPVASNTGKPGQDTPRGAFSITRKVKDEISREFNNAPMPWAVYFTNNGHAFHQGSVNVQSAGCVRLEAASAQRFFQHLNVGDRVFIY